MLLGEWGIGMEWLHYMIEDLMRKFGMGLMLDAIFHDYN